MQAPRWIQALVTVFVLSMTASGWSAEPTQRPLLVTVDLDQGESQTVTLSNGRTVDVRLVEVEETRDDVRQAVRHAKATVRVNDRTVDLVASAYHLPVTVGDVQIDCAVTRGYTGDSSKGNAWALEKDARFRLWPAGSPWVDTDTFVYPVNQRWFATDTQMGNVPCFVDAAETPGARNVYYHYGLDFGGPEGLVDVLSATDGLVVSSGTAVLESDEQSPAKPRYDVVYIRDDRGWFYRYSHLQMIATAVRPGYRVRKGERIGILGKEGGSGGWSHLHFDITAMQPSGRYGILNAYPLAWQAYQAQYQPDIIAVARPHHVAWTGQKVVLDGRKSWSRTSGPLEYAWTLSDGSTARGATLARAYDTPGEYSEVLRVTDAAGHVAYDFAVVQVFDKARPDRLPPTIHAAYWPTFDIRPGRPVTFKVRSFRTTRPEEVWDFGDGSPPVTVHSDGNANVHSLDGYAVTQHAFARPGDYVVTVHTTNQHGYTATTHLHVRVEQP